MPRETKGDDGRPAHGSVNETIVWYGQPALQFIGTTCVEHHNATVRHQKRRFTRRTLAFSKRLRNLRAAVAICVAWYDFCRWHGSLKMTTTRAEGRHSLGRHPHRLTPSSSG